MFFMRKKKQLVRAGDDQCFWCNHGVVVHDLRELHDHLQEMSDEEFKYHVNKEKNDFSTWIRDVLHDSECAKSLERVKTRRTAISKVASCLEGYKK